MSHINIVQSHSEHEVEDITICEVLRCLYGYLRLTDARRTGENHLAKIIR